MANSETKPKTKRLRRYKLVTGGHTDKKGFFINAKGDKIPLQVKTSHPDSKNPRYVSNPLVNGGRGLEPGDVYETDRDLIAMYGIGRFEEVGNDGVTIVPTTPVSARQFLDMMTAEQVVAYAATEEIDIEDLKKRTDIIDRIVQSKGQE